jgi:hypothetical protein
MKRAEKMDKTTLLDMLVSNHIRFESLIAQISPEKMLKPLEGDVQSGKDIVSHVTTWQHRLINWFAIVAQGGIPHSPEPGLTWQNMDQLNEQAEQRNKDRSLEYIIGDFRQSFQEFITLIKGFSEEELNTSYPFAWGELRHGEENRQLWVSALAGPGYAHYQDHFYDLLKRVDPAQHFIPDPELLKSYIGTYALPPRPSFTFSIEEGHLRVARKGRIFSCIPLDEQRFAFEDVGLITFYPDSDGTVSTLEWWAWHFRRTEET